MLENSSCCSSGLSFKAYSRLKFDDSSVRGATCDATSGGEDSCWMAIMKRLASPILSPSERSSSTENVPTMSSVIFSFMNAPKCDDRCRASRTRMTVQNVPRHRAAAMGPNVFRSGRNSPELQRRRPAGLRIAWIIASTDSEEASGYADLATLRSSVSSSQRDPDICRSKDFLSKGTGAKPPIPTPSMIAAWMIGDSQVVKVKKQAWVQPSCDRWKMITWAQTEQRMRLNRSASVGKG